jgi:hypothetical protein
MKKLLTLLFAVILLFGIEAPAQSITIGLGQYITSGNTYGPMRSNTTANINNRHAYIYPAQFLTGMPPGSVINSLEWYKHDAVAMIGGETLKIYVKLTNLPDWGAPDLDWPTAITGATLVFDGAPQSIVGSGNGFIKFPFTTSVTYDTSVGKGIAIFVEYYQPTAQTAAIQWRYDNATGVPGYTLNQVKYVNGTGNTFSNTLASENERHPQLKLNFPAAFNMAATQILFPTPGFIISGPTPVQARYTNTGLNTMTGGTVGVKMYDVGNNLVYNQTATIGSVLSGQSIDVTFPQAFVPTANGVYNCKSFVTATGDLYPPDDTLFFQRVVNVPQVAMVVVFSRATANERANKDSVLNALNTLGTPYDTLNRDLGTPDLTGWKSVLWCEEGSIDAAQRTAMINFLASGTTSAQKSLLIAGDDIGYFHDIGQSSADSTFYKYYLHADYRLDDGNGAPDNHRICGLAVNPGLCDSLISSYPDGITPVLGGIKAYRFADLWAGSDTVVSVAYDGPEYNVLYHAFEFREIVKAVTDNLNQVLSGSIQWIESVGGIIPVELASLNANVKGTNVTLNWRTASETNNKGFVIERSSENGQFINVGYVEGSGTTTQPTDYSFTDQKVKAGTYTYRLRQIDLDGTSEIAGQIEVVVSVPKEFALEQNYPNPFNPSTTIKYSVPVDGRVTLSVFNSLGEKVADLVNQNVEAGSYEYYFDASQLSSGVYFYRIEAGNFTSIKKMMLVK